jgi:hypothetical protein
MQHNKRQRKRAHLIYYLDILDIDSGANIGHLADITPEGIMIVSEAPVSVDKDFSFRLLLPSEISGRQDIEFKARCLWCKQDFIPDFYVSGYKIQDLTPQELKTVTDLINSYGFKSR